MVQSSWHIKLAIRLSMWQGNLILYRKIRTLWYFVRYLLVFPVLDHSGLKDSMPWQSVSWDHLSIRKNRTFFNSVSPVSGSCHTTISVTNGLISLTLSITCLKSVRLVVLLGVHLTTICNTVSTGKHIQTCKSKHQWYPACVFEQKGWRCSWILVAYFLLISLIIKIIHDTLLLADIL